MMGWALALSLAFGVPAALFFVYDYLTFDKE